MTIDREAMNVQALVLDIEEFVDGLRKPSGSQWFHSNNYRVYIRYLVVRGLKRLELSNVMFYPKGQGLFRFFLGELEKMCARKTINIYVENVLTERFMRFFRTRNGYVEGISGCFTCCWDRECSELSNYCFGYDKYGHPGKFDVDYLDDERYSTIKHKYVYYVRLNAVQCYYPIDVLKRLFPYG